MMNQQLNIIQKNGDASTQFEFDEIIPISSEMIMVKVDSKVGYINSKNEWVVELSE